MCGFWIIKENTNWQTKKIKEKKTNLSHYSTTVLYVLYEYKIATVLRFGLSLALSLPASQAFLQEMTRGRARHKTINGRFIDWAVLRDVYRHDLNKHHLIFDAVAIMIPLEMLPFECFSQHDSAVK
jgi:hypothetical protein